MEEVRKLVSVKNLLSRLILCPLFYLCDFLRMQCFLWAPFMLFGHDYGIFILILICTMCDSCHLWYESCVLLSGYCVLLQWIRFLLAKAVEVARVTLSSFFHPFTIIMVRILSLHAFLCFGVYSSFIPITHCNTRLDHVRKSEISA